MENKKRGMWLFLILIVLTMVFVIADATNPPTQSEPILNATSWKNLSVSNLTLYNQSTQDLDGDNVKNIYNWYKDGESMTVLNLPFEGGSNGTWTNDYSSYDNEVIVINGNWTRTRGYDGFGAYELDGSELDEVGWIQGMNVSDADHLSFTNGVNDLPFSISSWAKVDNISYSFLFVSKTIFS